MKFDPHTIGYLKQLGQAASVGLAMVLAIAFGCLLGWWVDRTWPDLAPYGKLAGLAIGILAAYHNLYIMVNRIKKEMDKDDRQKPN